MHRFLVYLFPGILMFLEWVLRSAMEVDGTAFLGPALVGASLGFAMSLVVPKKLSVAISSERQRWVDENRLTLRLRRDEYLIFAAWLFILIFLGVWDYSVYLALKNPTSEFLSFPAHAVIGVVSYGIAMVLAEIKDAL